jgi:hypothetical protein
VCYERFMKVLIEYYEVSTKLLWGKNVGTVREQWGYCEGIISVLWGHYEAILRVLLE